MGRRPPPARVLSGRLVGTAVRRSAHRARWAEVEAAMSNLDALQADVAVDPNEIEKHLAELWRASKEVADDALTRAALWNVVAHTSSAATHTQASQVLGRASAAVPQRTIVVRADTAA